MKRFKIKSIRALVFRACTALVLIIVAVIMIVIGRGHTVYIDNRTLEHDGQTYAAYSRVQAYVDGERVANLAPRERGMAQCIGQTFTMTLNVTQEQGGEEEVLEDIKLPLPYGLDGIIINVPAYLAGQPEEVYLTEFIPAPDTDTEDEDFEIPAEGDLLEDF